MRLGHQGHGLRILGLLVQSPAQRADRLVGLVALDQPFGRHLESLDLVGVAGKDAFHQLAGADLVSGFKQHPGKRDLVLVGLFVLLGAVDHPLQHTDALILPPAVEQQACLQRLQDVLSS